LSKGDKKKSKKPIVAVTMGDPTGVGPEVILKALAEEEVWEACTPLVFGDVEVLKEWADFLSIPIRVGEWGSETWRSKTLQIVPVSNLPRKVRKPGRPSVASGEASYQYIRQAASAVFNGTAQALCTAPINKRFVHLAGHPYPGHTEMLAEWSRTKEFRMMLIGGTLRVVLVTIHVPLAQVATLLTEEAIFKTILLTHKSLTELFGVAKPRIAVAAFNPHAGEDGSFGVEENRAIRPAVQESKKRGIRADGPLPADGLFARVNRWQYDAVVCMYHDQGLIPVKLLDFYGGVGLTLGLPIIRTSVDHGTANEIAGKGIASHSSMLAAILLAGKLVQKKRN
jgi:4-hydroxythreonine-4-phosphate dehydrogenase